MYGHLLNTQCNFGWAIFFSIFPGIHLVWGSSLTQTSWFSWYFDGISGEHCSASSVFNWFWLHFGRWAFNLLTKEHASRDIIYSSTFIRYGCCFQQQKCQFDIISLLINLFDYGTAFSTWAFTCGNLGDEVMCCMDHCIMKCSNSSDTKYLALSLMILSGAPDITKDRFQCLYDFSGVQCVQLTFKDATWFVIYTN